MPSIDKRIVAMQFDHAQFERGVRSTISDMANLEQSLKMDGVGDSIKRVADKFSIFGAIGFTAIQSLTRGAIDLGGKMGRALIDPIVQGGKTRALNIEQAKFQFEGLGIDIETAMANALYAVEGTAYGLDSAAKAAGQLAASGVELGEDMENSLRGISGVAAMTNSSYDDIANVFTKVAGQGRLMGDDLNRLGSRGINAAADMAKAFNVTEDELRKMVSRGEVSFQDFADAMDAAFGEQATKANETYTGALANMNSALGRVGAMFQELKLESHRRFFNAARDVINDFAKALDPLVALYGEVMRKSAEFWENFLGGLDLYRLKKIFIPLSRVIENTMLLVGDFGRFIKRAWDDIFGHRDVHWIDSAADAMERLRDWIKALRPSGYTLAKIQRTFAGLFAVLDIGIFIIGEVIKFIADLLGVVFEGDAGILDFTATIGDWLVALRDAIKSGEGFSAILKTIGEVVAIPIRLIKALIGVVTDLFMALFSADGFKDFGSKIKKHFEPLGHLGERLSDIWEKVSGGLQKFFDWVAPMFEGVIGKAKEFGKKIGGAFRDGDFSLLFDLLNAGLLTTLTVGLKGLMDSFKGITDNFGGFTSILSGVTDTLTAMQNNLKAGMLLKIAGAIAILAVAILLLASIDPVKLTIALGAITLMFGQLMGALAIFSKISASGTFIKMPVIAAGLVILSAAVVILSTAVRILAKLDWNQMSRGLVGVAVILAAMAGYTHIAKGRLGGLITTAAGMVILASAVRIMASAVTKLSDLSWEKMAKGLIAVGAIMAAMIAFSRYSTGAIKAVPVAIGMTILAAAILIMYESVKRFATMDWASIGRGLAAMGGALAILVLALNFTPPSSILGAVGLTVASASLLILAEALQRLGKMEWGEIGRALTLMLGALAMVVAASLLMTGGIVGAAAMLIVAPALLIMSDALAKMGKMEWGEIARASVMLLSALTLIGIAMTLMIVALPGAVALVVVSGALAILAPILMLFGNMEWEAIGKGLAMLGGSLLVIGIASLLVAPAVPIIALLGASIALLGIGVYGVGAGLLAFSAGLAALAAAGSVGIAFLIGLVTELIDLIPHAMSKFGEGIIAFAGVIEKGAPALMRAFESIFTEWLKVIDRMSPVIAETLAKLLLLLLSTIEKYMPQYVEKGSNIIISFLNGIEEKMPDIVAAGTNLAITFIIEVAKGLAKIADAAVVGIILFIRSVTISLNRRLPALRAAGRSLAFAIVDGMTGGMLSGIANSRVGRAASSLASRAWSSAKRALGIASPSKVFAGLGVNVAEGFALGIDKSGRMVEKSSERMGGSAVSALSEAMSGLRTGLDDNLEFNPVITPVLDLSSIKQDAKKMAGMMPSQAVDAQLSRVQASSIFESRQETPEKVKGEKEKVGEVTYNQYNYSPKSLNEAEIYRRTRNQISMLKVGGIKNDHVH